MRSSCSDGQDCFPGLHKKVFARIVLGGPRVALGLGLLLSAVASIGAEVFVSVAPDGSLRYATQPLDATYRLAFQEVASEVRVAFDRQTSLTPRGQRLRPIINKISMRHGVQPALVEGVAWVESRLDSNAISPKGAKGVMQLMPAVAAQYGLVVPDAWQDPERNIDAGTRYLKRLIALHHGNVALALAAYNAGPGTVARYGSRIPPYRETLLYVPTVLARSAAEAASAP